MVVFIEQNGTGNSCGHIQEYLQERHHNIYFISARPRDTPGIIKTEDVTQSAGNIWAEVLAQRGVCFHQNFVTYKRTQEEELSINSSCFNSFRSEPHYIMASQRTVYHLTAKTNARSDDAFIALLVSLYWKTRFWTSPNRYHDQIESINTFNSGGGGISSSSSNH